MNAKKILIIVVALLAAAGIVAAGVLLKGEPPTEPPGGATLPTGTLPLPGTGTGTGSGVTGDDLPGGDGTDDPVVGVNEDAFGVVSQASVLDYVLTPEAGLLMIDAGGAVISASSSEAIIARANFGGLLGAWFSPDGDWLLVSTGGSGSVRWSMLNVEQRTWRDIPANTSEMVWSPDGGQLAYFARRTDGSTLTAFNPDTGATRALLALSAPDMTLRWQDENNIFVMDRPSARVQGNVWDLTIAGAASTLTPFAVNVAGADIIWGSENSGGLLFKAGPTGGILALVDSRGNTSQVANFLTLPSKCVFGDSAAADPVLADYLLCAIPRDANQLKSRQLPDDYFQRELITSDALYAVDLRSGGIFPIMPAAQTSSFDAENMSVYGDDLYFVDRGSQKLYKAPLSAVIGLQSEE